MLFRSNEQFVPWSEFCQVLEQLKSAAQQDDCITVRKLLSNYVDGYVPQGEIVDLIYNQRSLSSASAE